MRPKMKGKKYPKLYNCAAKTCGCEKSGVI